LTRTLKKYLWLFLLAVVSSGLGFYFYSNPSLKSWEEDAVDLFFSLRPTPRNQKIPEVVLVMVDSKAVGKRYGYYDPLPRRYLARLIDTLSSGKAKIIALDIALFDKYDVLDPTGDTLLAEAMMRAGNVSAVCAYETNESGETRIRNPHPFFQKALKGVGYANLEASSTGGFATVRSVRPYVQSDGSRMVPSFSSLVYCLDRNLDVQQFLDAQIGAKPMAGISLIPLARGAMVINFVGPPPVWQKDIDGSWIQQKEGRIVTFRSSVVTEGGMQKSDAFGGKVVFVGVFSEFSLDQFLTPYSSVLFDNEPMRGVEVHANAFLTIARDNYIQVPAERSVLLLLMVVAFLTVAMTSRFGLVGDLLFVGPTLIVIWASGYLCFVSYNLWIPAASLSLTVVFSYVATTVYSGLTERRERRRITSIFGQYVDERVVKQLIENPEMSKIGGENREVTILFSDLKGFTKLSERLGAEKIVKLMNVYLTEMTDIIRRNEGTIDKFIGDSIMAFWGAPLPNPDAPYLACLSALQMQTRLEEMTSRWSEFGDIEVKQRIGLNTGVCIIGNVGSERKTNYTAIGDAVNLASRLEGVNKLYGTSILISEFTYAKVAERFVLREIEPVIVQGKTEAVNVYELSARIHEPLTSELKVFLDIYRRALAAYNAGDLEVAAELFRQAIALDTDDPVCRYFLGKIKDPNAKDSVKRGQFMEWK
jgi:class 3 adenylate cyclase/CHASE2 domain-containing sensor protein